MRPRITPLLSLALLAAAACSGGCLKRTISVTTEPPGALVWINDVEVGRTPLETDFTFYGNYDVRIRREGYEPLITSAKAKTPIQEQPGIDLLAEAAPVRLSNTVHWHFTLTPLAEQGSDKQQAEHDLIARASELRAQIPAKAAPEAPKADAPAAEPAPAAPKG